MFYKLKSKIPIEFWVILALFIAGLLVRLYNLGGPSLSDDEIYTATWINHSLSDTILFIRQWEFPPLYFVILNLWVSIFGNGEWALRFPSAAFSSLTILVIYKLGKELFSRYVGLISASLLVFSQFALIYAQNAKMYPLFWFLVAGSFLFLFRFLKDQGEGSFRFYIIASILYCYTMYTGFLLLLTQNIIFLLMRERTGWKKWFTGQLVIVSFCIPWVLFFYVSRHVHWDSLRSPNVAFDYLGFFFESFLSIIGSARDSWEQFPVNLYLVAVNCILYIILIAFLLIDVSIKSHKNKKIGLLLPTNYFYIFMWVIIPTLIYVMFDCFFVRADLGVRHIGFLQIPIILLMSSQLNNLHGLIQRILVLVLIVISMNNTYLYFRTDFKDAPQGWRRTAEELTQDFGQNDIVLSFIDIPMFQYYYKGDAQRFFKVSAKNFSSEVDSLIKNKILTEHVCSIFVLFHGRRAPEINIYGFTIDYRVLNKRMGFIHFKRIQSECDSGK